MKKIFFLLLISLSVKTNCSDKSDQQQKDVTITIEECDKQRCDYDLCSLSTCKRELGESFQVDQNSSKSQIRKIVKDKLQLHHVNRNKVRVSVFNLTSKFLVRVVKYLKR